jgi:hypothetical protein
MVRIAKNRKSLNCSMAEAKYAFKVLTGVKIGDTFPGPKFYEGLTFLINEFGAERIAEVCKGFDREDYINGRVDC